MSDDSAMRETALGKAWVILASDGARPEDVARATALVDLARELRLAGELRREPLGEFGPRVSRMPSAKPRRDAGHDGPTAGGNTP